MSVIFHNNVTINVRLYGSYDFVHVCHIIFCYYGRSQRNLQIVCVGTSQQNACLVEFAIVMMPSHFAFGRKNNDQQYRYKSDDITVKWVSRIISYLY